MVSGRSGATKRSDDSEDFPVDREQTVKAILEDWDSGLLTRGALPMRLLEVLTTADVDAQLAELSPDRLDWVVWELRDNYAPIIGHDPAAYGIIEGVTVLPGNEEEYRLDLARREEHMRTVAVPSIQRWLRVHPLPARDPFPTAIVRCLHARTERARTTLWASKPPHFGAKQWRTWPERERYDDLLSLEIELEKSLHRAELAGAGSQEQALAWQGLERVAHILAAREDLTVEERQIVIEACQRGGERGGSFRP